MALGSDFGICVVPRSCKCGTRWTSWAKATWRQHLFALPPGFLGEAQELLQRFDVRRLPDVKFGRLEVQDCWEHVGAIFQNRRRRNSYWRALALRCRGVGRRSSGMWM